MELVEFTLKAGNFDIAYSCIFSSIYSFQEKVGW